MKKITSPLSLTFGLAASLILSVGCNSEKTTATTPPVAPSTSGTAATMAEPADTNVVDAASGAVQSAVPAGTVKKDADAAPAKKPSGSAKKPST